jgi:hypothetical protein
VDDQRHGERFEQQREAGAGPRPRHIDLPDAALAARDAGRPRMQECLVLEEVEMPPRLPRGVVDGAVGGLAVRTRKAPACFEVDLDVEALSCGVEVGGGDEPRRVDAEGKLEELGIEHVGTRVEKRS